jgi:hypothetical protein
MAMPISAARWEGFRALREGAPATYPLLATVGCVHEVTLRKRGAREGWPKVDLRRPVALDGLSVGSVPVLPLGESGASLTDQAAALASVLAGQMEGVLAAAREGRIDKARIDAVLAMIRLVERAGSLTRESGQGGPESREAGNQEKTRSDEQLADIYSRIDARIDAMARYYATRMVAGEALPG